MSEIWGKQRNLPCMKEAVADFVGGFKKGKAEMPRKEMSSFGCPCRREGISTVFFFPRKNQKFKALTN